MQKTVSKNLPFGQCGIGAFLAGLPSTYGTTSKIVLEHRIVAGARTPKFFSLYDIPELISRKEIPKTTNTINSIVRNSVITILL